MYYTSVTMECIENKNFAEKALERREYSGLEVVLKSGHSRYTSYVFITSLEYLPSDNLQEETLKIASCDFNVIIKGKNLIPIKNDLKVKVVDTLQAGKEYRNVSGEVSVVDDIEIKES